jgi:hypothetical protein
MAPSYAPRIRRSAKDAIKRTDAEVRERRVTLRVGFARDPAEAQADRVAESVMVQLGRREPAPSRSTWPSQTRIQRSTIGADGGSVDSATTNLIEGARGRGTRLQVRVRRSMEEAFGADFSGVRVHDDAAAHEANTRLTARAFTSGSDVFFGRDAYQPSRPAGERLIAHELAHVVQQGGAGTTRRVWSGDPGSRVQREMRYGDDPTTMIGDAGKDLLYGIATARHKTKMRLRQAQTRTIRTIDQYNDAIGVNGIMRDNAAMGLYRVREALNSTDDWSLPIDDYYYRDPNKDAIDLWIAFLRDHAAHVGLEDLGVKGEGSKSRIDEKNRFKKNRDRSQAKDKPGDRLTSSDTREFLSPELDTAAAQVVYDKMSPTKKVALNRWVHVAFFRRTSKLGETFAITKLHARVHFNTMADPNFNRKAGENWKDRGLEAQSEKGKNDKSRSITVSEFRHMQKLKKQYPNQFNEYGEV